MYIQLQLCIIWFTLYMKESKAVCTVVEETSKNVCSGDSVQLFRNVKIDSIDMVVTLYLIASNERILAMWTAENTTISDGYTTKVFLEKNGDIWIHNVFPSEDAQYILTSQNGTICLKYIVTLSVQVAPTINCKPSITRADDVLVASLNPIECGKPLVSVDWLSYSGIQIKSNEFVFPETTKYGIYYACISGPAVKCAETLKLSDYCSVYAISDTPNGQDNSSKPGIEHIEPNYSVVMLIAIFLVLVLVIFILLLLFLSKYKNGTLCGNRKSAKDVQKSDYTALSTTLSDVTPPSVKISLV